MARFNWMLPVLDRLEKKYTLISSSVINDSIITKVIFFPLDIFIYDTFATFKFSTHFRSYHRPVDLLVSGKPVSTRTYT